MGGSTGKTRDQHMRDLIERGFDVILKKPAPPRPRLTVKREAYTPQKNVQPISTAILKLRGSNGQLQTITHGTQTLTRPRQTEWSLHLGDFASPHDAKGYLLKITGHNPAFTPHIQVLERDRHFQARLSGLEHKQAGALCVNIRAKGQSCRMVQQTS